MTLPLLFIITPSIEYLLKPICHHIISYVLIPFANFIHDPILKDKMMKNVVDLLKKSDNPLIWQEVHSSFREKSPVLFLVHFVNWHFLWHDWALAFQKTLTIGIRQIAVAGLRLVVQSLSYWRQLRLLLLDVFHYQIKLLLSYLPVVVRVQFENQFIH